MILFDHMRAENFIREGLEFKMDVVTSAAEVIPAFEYRLQMARKKVPVEALLGKL